MTGHVKHWRDRKVATPLPPAMARTFVGIVNQHKGCWDGGMEGSAGNFDNGHYNLAWTFGEYLSQGIEPLKRD